MPRDQIAAQPTTRPTAHTLQYAAARRAELLGDDNNPGLFASLATMRRRGHLVPFERQLMPMTRANLAALSKWSGMVLP